MQLSYWELKNWFTNVDYTVVGKNCWLMLLYACAKISNSKILLEGNVTAQEVLLKMLVLLFWYFRDN
jgi:hypothetical protein